MGLDAIDINDEVLYTRNLLGTALLARKNDPLTSSSPLSLAVDAGILLLHF